MTVFGGREELIKLVSQMDYFEMKEVFAFMAGYEAGIERKRTEFVRTPYKTKMSEQGSDRNEVDQKKK